MIGYTVKKGYTGPLCTSINCKWKKATKKDIKRKMTRDIVIRKKLGSNTDKNGKNENVNSEEWMT